MRTLHIDTERGWRGGEQQSLYLMTGLARKGHVAEAACRRSRPLAARVREAGLTALEVNPVGELDVCAAAQIAHFIAERRYDIIHAHTSHAHTLGQLARLMAAPWLRPVPPLVVSRRVDFPIHTLPLGLNALKYRFGVACYLAVAARVRDVLIEGGVPPNRIRVVPSSVDISRFEGASAEGLREEFGIAPSAKVVVNVGSLVGHKAQWHLVRAMPHVLERFPEAVCILVGEGPTRRRLETLAQELGIGKHVIFAGFRQDVARFISLCDVFAVSSEMEGLCSTILEAMALRRPVVSTRAGGIPDIVKDGVNGLLVAPGDPDALARGMLRVLENPRAASELAEEGRRTVERRFTTERMVASTLAVYEELLGRRRGLE